MQFKVTHVLIAGTAIASLVLLRPLAPALLGISLVFYCAMLAVRDLTGPLRPIQKGPPTKDHEYYLQFEPKPKRGLFLAIGSLFVVAISWLLGTLAGPGETPTIQTLVLDVAITVTGVTLCACARQKSQSKFQTAITWIPLAWWLLHSLEILGNKLQEQL